MNVTYSYDAVIDIHVTGATFYRVRDDNHNRVATCYTEKNAELVVRALNALECTPDKEPNA